MSFSKLGGYLGAYSLCRTCTVKISSGTGDLYKQFALDGLEQIKEWAVSLTPGLGLGFSSFLP